MKNGFWDYNDWNDWISTIERDNSSNNPCLLLLSAHWCQPCRYAKPIAVRLAQKMDGKMTVGIVDIDEIPDAAIAFGVSSVPSWIALCGNRIIGKFVGVISEHRIDHLGQSIVDRCQDDRREVQKKVTNTNDGEK